MLKYLQLIRLPNLLMIPLTMYLLRWGVIQTALEYGYSQELGQALQLVFPNKRGGKIVQISDLHLGGFNYRFHVLEKAIKSIV